MATGRGVTPLWAWARQNARIRNEYVTESVAEFLGTTLLCFYAFGASAQYTIMGDSFVMAAFGGVFGLMTAVFVFGGISGAHLNPAVSLGLAIAGEVSWLKLPFYFFAQIFGGYIGALLGYGLYKDKLEQVTGVNGHISCPFSKNTSLSFPERCPHMAGLFSPYKPDVSLSIGIADQAVTTAVLLMAVFSFIDKLNMKVQRGMLAFFVCLVVAAQAFCYGENAGAVLNPARDLGPRLAALSVGFTKEYALENYYLGEKQQWWLVGIIGPLLGGIVGTLVYIFTVGAHLKDEGESEQKPEKNPIQNADGSDWRSTQFLPKAKAQPPANEMNHDMNGNHHIPNRHRHQEEMLGNNNTPYRNEGQTNQGYLRGPGQEDTNKYRNGY